MNAWLWSLVAVTGYLLAGRLSFYAMTRLDFPKITVKARKCSHGYIKWHENLSCHPRQYDSDKSIEMRTLLAFAGPAVLAVLLAIGVVVVVLGGAIGIFALKQPLAPADKALREQEKTRQEELEKAEAQKKTEEYEKELGWRE